MPNSDRIIRLKTVLARVGFSRATLYRKMADGSFPRPLRIGIHGVGWRESAIDHWIAELPVAGNDNDTPDAKEASHGA